MARKRRAPADEPLLAEIDRRYERRTRRQRTLFIPRFVREEAGKPPLDGERRDRAHAIALRWAQLETLGRLHDDRETSIDVRFLDELFGEGLGYSVKSTDANWELEHKRPVQGVGIADAALGDFPANPTPRVVIELKGAAIDLDRDRSNGRTAVQQCWDYLNALPECQWGIVSNFRTIRLYHKARGILAYEEFALQELRDRSKFDEFHVIFEHDGLLPSRLGQPPRVELLLKKTAERQKTVGDELYKQYQSQRLRLIEYLHQVEKKELDEAIRIAQKLLDRIIFIAFCEDRELLPDKTLATTINDTDRYSRAKNPAWDNFLKLFTAIDQGVETDKVRITPFNGGLFADDPAINSLVLKERKWTNGLAGFGLYDFSEEVNVDVLGRLFERSITELEKLRIGGLYALKANAPEETRISKMPKSVSASASAFIIRHRLSPVSSSNALSMRWSANASRVRPKPTASIPNIVEIRIRRSCSPTGAPAGTCWRRSRSSIPPAAPARSSSEPTMPWKLGISLSFTVSPAWAKPRPVSPPIPRKSPIGFCATTFSASISPAKGLKSPSSPSGFAPPESAAP